MNTADQKAEGARAHERGYAIGYGAGKLFQKYALPGIVTFVAVKYAIRSALKESK